MPSNATWSRHHLIDLVTGAHVTLRDPCAQALPLPDWLGGVVAGVMEHEPATLIESAQGPGREDLVRLFLEAAEAPGRLLEASVTLRTDGGERAARVSAVDLSHQPEVGGTLFTVRYLRAGPEEALDPVAGVGGGDIAATDWMLLTIDESSRIITAGGRVGALLGRTPDELVGTRTLDHLAPESLGDSVRVWAALRTAPDLTVTSRRPWRRADGGSIWLESSYLNRADPPPGEGRVLVVVWDITERRAAERRLAGREAELRTMAEDLRALADEVPSAVFRCGPGGEVGFHNARWEELLSERSGVARLHDLFTTGSQDRLDQLLAVLAASGDGERRVVELEGADGATSFRLGLRAIGDGVGGTAFLGSLEDITATVRLRAEASRDPLTGLLNRGAIEAEIADLDERGGADDLIAFLDLDGFKDVNDTHGHDVGDLVLVEVAERLRRALRHDDVAGRWGGDEFVLVCRGIRGDGAAQLTERLRELISVPIGFDGGCWHPSVSVGIARPAGDGPTALLRRADQAMFRHKRHDRERRGRADSA